MLQPNRCIIIIIVRNIHSQIVTLCRLSTIKKKLYNNDKSDKNRDCNNSRSSVIYHVVLTR